MKQCRSIQFVNRLVLAALALFVAGSAMCAVAASASDQERGASAAITAAR